MFLNRKRAMLQRAYLVTLGLSEFHNESDIDQDWIDAISENDFDADEIRFEINADRWSMRQKRDLL